MKKTINHNVTKAVKAVTLGVAAVAASGSMTAMAAEPDIEAPEEDAKSESKMASASDAADEADEANETAGKSESDVIDGVNNKENVSGDIKDAAGNLKDEAFDENGDNDADTLIDEAKNDIKTADDALTENDKQLTDATNKADEIEDIVADADAKLDSAASDINASIDTIKNATTIDEAKAAYDKVEKLATAAASDLDNAKNSYDAAKADYDAAVTAAKQADEAYQTAVVNAKSNVDDAFMNLQNVKAKADALQSEIDEAQAAYDKAVADANKILADATKAKEEAEAKLNEAEKKLNEAETKLNEAETAKKTADENYETALKEYNTAKENLAAAEDDLKDINQLALEIVKLEQQVANGGVKDWSKCDKLFIAIIKNYYVPEVLEAELVSADAQFTKLTPDEQNYYEFTILKDGVETTLRYNYKLAENGKDLIIFEKYKEEVVIQEAVDEYYVYVSNNIQTSLSADEFNELVKSGKIVEVDGAYFLKTNSGTVVDNNVSGATGEKTTTTTVDSKGQVVETTTADVTEYGAEAELTYSAKFTSTFNVAGLKTMQSDGWNSGSIFGLTEKPGDDAREFVEDIMQIITDELEKNGFKILDSNVSNVSAEKTKDNKKKHWYDSDPKDEFTFKSGNITITYAKQTKEKIDFSTWDAFVDWFNGDQSKDEIKQKAFEEGMEINDFSSWNWSLSTANVSYYDYYTVTGTAKGCETEEEAKAAAKTDAVDLATKDVEKKASDNNKLVNSFFDKAISEKKATNKKYNATTSGTAMHCIDGVYAPKSVADASTIKSDDIKTDKKVSEDVVLSTITYKATQVTYVPAVPEKTELRYADQNTNKNFNDGNISLYEYGDSEATLEFRAFLKDAEDAYLKVKKAELELSDKQTKKDTAESAKKEKEEAYNSALSDKNNADAAYNKADKDLSDSINAYNRALANKKAAVNATNYSELVKLARKAVSDVEAATAKVEELKKILDGLDVNTNSNTLIMALNAQLSAAQADLKEAEDKYNRLSELVKEAEDTLNDKVAALTPAPVQSTVTITDTQVPLAVLPGAEAQTTTTDTVVNTMAPAGQDTVTIQDPDTPLAPIADDADKTDVTDTTINLNTIDEAEVPLGVVDDIDADSKDKDSISWWWLLLVAAMGATGYEVYKKHNEKKAPKSDN